MRNLLDDFLNDFAETLIQRVVVESGEVEIDEDVSIVFVLHVLPQSLSDVTQSLSLVLLRHVYFTVRLVNENVVVYLLVYSLYHLIYYIFII